MNIHFSTKYKRRQLFNNQESLNNETQVLDGSVSSFFRNKSKEK